MSDVIERCDGMELDKVLEQLRGMFDAFKIEEVEEFLESNIGQAFALGDINAVISLMNEMIGYLRDTGKDEKALYYCDRVMELIKQSGITGTVAHGTTLLNVANAYRAAGKLQESMIQYQAVFNIYDGKIDKNDMLYASLYNNLSLLYQEMGDFEKACECLKHALSIVLTKADKRIEAAVTYTNLASSQLQLGEFTEAVENLMKAFAIFDMDERKDFHYGGALAAMAQAQYLMGYPEKAAAYYRQALAEVRKHTGESTSYAIILKNLQEVEKAIENNLPGVQKVYVKGMDLCEDFYKEYGIPMIHNCFPEYESVIATGLVGEGSECFGFDDSVSRDHDFGPGFCMWLTDSVYDEIGERLQAEYDKLPTTYMGITRRTTKKAKKRVGVFKISEFYENLFGFKDVPTTQNQWLFVEDYQLAAATNGKVFRDDLGEFSRIRKELLKHYPEEVRVKKIAREAALMAQSGQYNYARMYGRGDNVTAMIALSEFMKHTMMMVYLLNHRYAPFYKWMHRGMEHMVILSQIKTILDELAQMPIGDERIPETIEFIVALIIQEMKKQGLTSGEDNYLDNHTDKILKSIPVKKDSESEVSFKESLVNELVQIEWKAFDKVENIGGRANCQDDFNTFSIMRKSQYLTWTEPMLRSYIHDFVNASDNGLNLIAQKYGRMMESTDPAGYEEICDKLPYVLPQKREIIEAIVQIQVSWMEDLALRYPKIAKISRSIHTYEDNIFNTSYETYLRGELLTYSDNTLDLYGRFIADLCNRGENLAEMTMSNTAMLYGYSSLEELEQGL